MKRISLKPSQMSLLSRYTQDPHLTSEAIKARLLTYITVLPSPSSIILHYVSIQIYSSRDLEDNLNKIREICSDDKHDWDQRAIAVSRFFL